MYLFDQDVKLHDLRNSCFTGVVSDNWLINGNPNGGYLMALIAAAMLRKSDKKETPIITANYLSRCVPGAVEIHVSEIARSRQFNRFEARLTQEGQERIRAFGTFVSEPDKCGISRYETKSPELAPVEECVQMPYRLPKYTFFHNVDLMLDPSCAGWLTGNLADISENKGYIKFRDNRPIDIVSLFLIIDAMPPAVLATYGRTRWVPTVELSVNIRNLPQTDRVKCILRTRFITRGLFEADGEVWDEKGNLAAISRQIALFKKV